MLWLGDRKGNGHVKKLAFWWCWSNRSFTQVLLWVRLSLFAETCPACMLAISEPQE